MTQLGTMMPQDRLCVRRFLWHSYGPGCPCPPIGKSVKTDYVYVMDFDGEKIRHVMKI